MMVFEGLLRKYKLSLLLDDVVFSDVESKIIEYLNFNCEKFYKNKKIALVNDPLHKLVSYSKISGILLDSGFIFNSDDILILINEWYNYYKLSKDGAEDIFELIYE